MCVNLRQRKPKVVDHLFVINEILNTSEDTVVGVVEEGLLMGDKDFVRYMKDSNIEYSLFLPVCAQF